MLQKLFSLVLVAALFACSQDDSGTGDSKKPPQNSKISGSATNTLTSQAALFEAARGLGSARVNGRPQGGNLDLLTATLSGLSSGGNVPSRAITREKSQRLEQILRTAELDRTCIFSIVDQPQTNPGRGSSAGQPQPDFPRLKVITTGNQCPLLLTFELGIRNSPNQLCVTRSSQIDCKFKGFGEMSYTVQDEELQTQFGLRSGVLKMDFDLEQSLPQSGAGRGVQTFLIKGILTIKLAAVDLERVTHEVNGTQSLDLVMKMDSGRAGDSTPGHPEVQRLNASELLTYSNTAGSAGVRLAASAQVNGGQSVETYNVDGQAVTAEVYQEEKLKFANSMMEFGRSGEESSSPGEPPVSNPPGNPSQPPGLPRNPGQPSPPVTPPPGNQPPVLPAPPTNPGRQEWTCLFKNASTQNVFIGSGPAESMATSSAKQSCQRSRSNSSCIQMGTCMLVEGPADDWFCDTQNTSFDQNFSGVGRNQQEAAYRAFQACVAEMGSPKECQFPSSGSCLKYRY